jgi:hypothetical protein
MSIIGVTIIVVQIVLVLAEVVVQAITVQLVNVKILLQSVANGAMVLMDAITGPSLLVKKEILHRHCARKLLAVVVHTRG